MEKTTGIDFSTCTVLIVDDKPANLGVVANYLQEYGYKTIVASSGLLALERARYVRPDIILLDIMMPGMNGFETCGELKKDDITREIPVLFMTALSDTEHKVQGFLAGAVDYITKPVQKKELLARVNAHLSTRKYGETLEREVRERTAQLEAANQKLKEEIVERKRIEDEITQLRNLLKNTIDSMPSVLVGVDGEGYINQWNLEAEKTTGVTADMALGRLLYDIFPELSGAIVKIKKAVDTLKIHKDEKVMVENDLGKRYQDVTIYPLVGNCVQGAVIRIDDVTERVRMDEMIIQSEKMLSVGGLAAGMAHEINSPLSGIIQTLQVMKSRISSDLKKNRETAKECGTDIETISEYMEKRDIYSMLDSVRDSGVRAAKTVDNMLSFSRKGDGVAAPRDLAGLMDDTLELAAHDYNLEKNFDFRAIDIVREYDAGLPKVLCEGNKLQQVILNILKNGAHEMMENEEVVEAPRFILRLKQDNSMARIEIEDNGPGMDEETRKRIFEPFFSTKAEGIGIGLGLSISCFIIMESHSGTLEVESSPGNGARFIICLPIKGK